ncbi:hypothetical protein GWI33_010551 [Rhynchophorus ferrugineus]|uniref:Uncharacterized protein n=1 Tax=Rhynchophorus ferrugineus TaxID=354439 RepID=A0A834MMA5_RHYFE|nr:hypothetical protein GWI33_010551 [Rhynchophorus ferrugineus]
MYKINYAIKHCSATSSRLAHSLPGPLFGRQQEENTRSAATARFPVDRVHRRRHVTRLTPPPPSVIRSHNGRSVVINYKLAPSRTLGPRTTFRRRRAVRARPPPGLSDRLNFGPPRLTADIDTAAVGGGGAG